MSSDEDGQGCPRNFLLLDLGCDVRGEGHLPTSVARNMLTVDPHVGLIVNCAEVQKMIASPLHGSLRLEDEPQDLMIGSLAQSARLGLEGERDRDIS